MVNLFVGKGQEVVSTKGKTPDWNKSYKTRMAALKPNLPLAILVDGKSASASESWLVRSRIWTVGLSWAKSLLEKGSCNKTKARLRHSHESDRGQILHTSGRCVQRLDYSHRDDAGKVHAQADSTLKTFTPPVAVKSLKDGASSLMSKSRRS